MGDLIALVFALFIVGAVSGGFKLGGRFVGTLLWLIAGVIMAGVAIASGLALVVGIGLIVAIVLVIISFFRRRRPRFYDCSRCSHQFECHSDCRGGYYDPVYPDHHHY